MQILQYFRSNKSMNNKIITKITLSSVLFTILIPTDANAIFDNCKQVE
jgi:hypothetical protein